MRDLYKTGSGFEEFLESGDEKDRKKTLSYLSSIELDSKLIKRIESINSKIYILAVAEIWCPDCMINIPALEYMNRLNKKLDYRIIKREGNEEHFKDYELEARLRIPTMIIMDDAYEELGSILERPKVLKKLYEEEDQIKIIEASRSYREGAYIKDMIEEIISIIGY